jgi:DNA-binding MarR family transcriptional regulator
MPKSMAKRGSIAAALSEDEADSGLDLGRLDGILGFHLRMAHVAVYRDFAATMSELGLTQKQLAVMELVDRNPGVSQIDLAQTLGTDRATMMALVDRLELRGIVVRRPSEVDRRRQELRLTASGAALLAAAYARVGEHEKRFLARFSGAELEALLGALKRIYRD